MNKNSEWLENDSNWGAELAGEAGNWFCVSGDVDDFIFYDSATADTEGEHRSTR